MKKILIALFTNSIAFLTLILSLLLALPLIALGVLVASLSGKRFSSRAHGSRFSHTVEGTFEDVSARRSSDQP